MTPPTDGKTWTLKMSVVVGCVWGRLVRTQVLQPTFQWSDLDVYYKSNLTLLGVHSEVNVLSRTDCMSFFSFAPEFVSSL